MERNSTNLYLVHASFGFQYPSQSLFDCSKFRVGGLGKCRCPLEGRESAPGCDVGRKTTDGNSPDHQSNRALGRNQRKSRQSSARCGTRRRAGRGDLFVISSTWVLVDTRSGSRGWPRAVALVVIIGYSRCEIL